MEVKLQRSKMEQMGRDDKMTMGPDCGLQLFCLGPVGPRRDLGQAECLGVQPLELGSWGRGVRQGSPRGDPQPSPVECMIQMEPYLRQSLGIRFSHYCLILLCMAVELVVKQTGHPSRPKDLQRHHQLYLTPPC